MGEARHVGRSVDGVAAAPRPPPHFIMARGSGLPQWCSWHKRSGRVRCAVSPSRRPHPRACGIVAASRQAAAVGSHKYGSGRQHSEFKRSTAHTTEHIDGTGAWSAHNGEPDRRGIEAAPPGRMVHVCTPPLCRARQAVLRQGPMPRPTNKASRWHCGGSGGPLSPAAGTGAR